MPLKIGLLVGREWSWPPKFIDEVQRLDARVVVEFIKLGGTRMNEPCPYAVLIDRLSHEVPYYRSYLKNAVLQGVTVINNPFVTSADDKFLEASLAAKLGVAHPKTAVLPNKDYGPGIVPTESLRNLIYPLDWKGLIEYTGLPCILKDAHTGRKNVSICYSLDELIYHYNQSGLRTMVVQEFIKWEHYVCCLCIGQEDVLPMPYDPEQRRYHAEHGHLGNDLSRRLVDDSLKLVRALGCDLKAVEWAVRDGVPYAIDFLHPAPDLDVHSLTPHYFQWAVQHLAATAIKLAKQPRPPLRELRWSKWF